MTLSFRPNDRGALRSMQKWPNSGGGWGNHHHQHGPMLEPSMSPLYNYASHQLQESQSMFPQLTGAAEQQAELLRAFVLQANAGEQQDGSLDSLLNSSRSSSMVDTTSEMTLGDDDICTAPENDLHNMTCITPGLASVILASRLDRDAATTGASLMNAPHTHVHSKEYSFRMESPGGPLSPCGEPREDFGQLHGGDHAMAGRLKRRWGDGDEHEEDPWMADQIMLARGKLHKFHRELSSEKAFMFQDSFGEFQAPSVAVTYSSAMQPPRPPFLQSNGGGGGNRNRGESEVASDLDHNLGSMRAMLFRHASQPVPSLDEIASSRPKRRNVRISKDPQSVAARHRRERISDRMRVLQRLVPGGTKMDTASMLDEAIHYVKFLKLQLQTLEQMRASDGCNPRFAAQQGGNSGAAQELMVSLARPFDLNCSTAAFQAWPGAPATTIENSDEAAQQTELRTQWASHDHANQASFPDHATM